MLERCTNCKSRILAGGVDFMNHRFCGEACANGLKVALAEQMVPESAIQEHARQLFEAACPLCGHTSGNDFFSATKVSGFVIAYQIIPERRLCCSQCGRKYRLLAALHCLLAGWWSPRAAFFNLFVLPTNLISCLFIRRPVEPSQSLIDFVKLALADSLAENLAADSQKQLIGST